MKKMKKKHLTILFTLFAIYVQSQDLSGEWQGLEFNSGAPISEAWPSLLSIEQSSNILNATLLQTAAKQPQSYVKYAMSGFIENSKNLTLTHQSVIEDKKPNGLTWCYGTLNLNYDESNEKLSGTSKFISSGCQAGTVELYRIKLKSPNEFCKGTRVSLRVSGKNVKWYSDVQRNKLLATGNSYNPNISETSVFFVTQSYYGIESPTVAITVKILDCFPINPCKNAKQKFNYHVTGVPIIPQPNHYTCWAASAAMMHWWHEKKNKNSISDALYEIEGGDYKFHQTFLISNDIFIISGGGIKGGEPEELYLNKMGLQTFSKPTDISQFNSYLKQFGPILISRHSSCSNPKYNGTGHVMIMTGIYGDGTQECTYFDIIDPWAWNDDDKKIQVKEERWSYNKLFECQWDFAYYPLTKKQLVIDEDKKYGKVKTKQGSNLNLRSKPSDKSSIVTKIPNGSRVQILGYDDKEVIVNGETGKWCNIEFKDTIGWAWGNFIILNSTAPVVKNDFAGLPVKIADIPIKYQRTINVKSREVTIYPFDNEKEDGDIVSININGVWVRDHFALKNKKSSPNQDDLIKCSLNPGDYNYFISRAWNVGSIAPNTLTIKIDDGVLVQEVLINSDVGLSGGIRIVCNK